MKNGENYNVRTRRTFLKSISAGIILASIPTFFNACKEKVITFAIRLSGTNHILGHRLRTKDFPKISKIIEIPYLIIGGGISGLSAGRQFKKKGIEDFLILELEANAGGNSRNGENKYSKYPLGAHYLPLPNIHDKELVQFLEESQIITGYQEGFPIFDEEQLTFMPQERLFFKNTWQESLVPKFGITKTAEAEFNRFFERMADYREKRGKDEKYIFDIPLASSSQDGNFDFLDKISMKKWLIHNKFISEELYQYVNYCCRDDFGLGIDFISSWAGIHYFASRKHNATKEKTENVLTWPEGNARLMNHLKEYSKDKIFTNHLVYETKIEGENVIVKAYDDFKKESVSIKAKKVIFATPQFINSYLLPDRLNITKDFHYAPWLLATLTVIDLDDNNSYPLCWDNVIYGAKGLGYIYNQHESLGQIQEKKVITYYYSFSTNDLKRSRKELLTKPEDYWKELIINDLKIAHPDIENVIQEIDIQRIGHGMISPVPGFLSGNSRAEASRAIENKIFFAHSDLSGISIFEEAFHQGINAVNKILE